MRRRDLDPREIEEAVYLILGLPITLRELIVELMLEQIDMTRSGQARGAVEAAFRKYLDGDAK